MTCVTAEDGLVIRKQVQVELGGLHQICSVSVRNAVNLYCIWLEYNLIAILLIRTLLTISFLWTKYNNMATISHFFWIERFVSKNVLRTDKIPWFWPSAWFWNAINKYLTIVCEKNLTYLVWSMLNFIKTSHFSWDSTSKFFFVQKWQRSLFLSVRNNLTILCHMNPILEV